MYLFSIKFYFTFIISTLLIFVYTSVEAQSISEKIKSRENELRNELDEIENEVEGLYEGLREVEGHREGIEGEISSINYDINKKQQVINEYSGAIQKLSKNIYEGEITIQSLNRRMEEQREVLSTLIQRLNEIDAQPYFFIGEPKTFSSFLEDGEDHLSLHKAIQYSFDEIRETRGDIENTIISLDDAKQKQERYRELEQVEKGVIEEKKREKDKVLTFAKQVEATVQDSISQKERRINSIRAELFELRGSENISLGEAVELAEFAEKITGVRPAFLLGIIKIETELGKNLGTGNWLDDMHPVRDAPVFEVIADTLDLNPNKLPVSRKPGYGWGGAMGPAQFIPSTWACYGGYVNTLTRSCGPHRENFILSSQTLDVGDTHSSIRSLQRFLNTNGFTVATNGDGSPGNESNYYGQATSRAVSRLQESYKSVILEPSNLTRGTGTVGPRTIYFINRFPFWTARWYYDKDKDIIRDLLGKSSPSNPWNPQDAFVASAYYLEELGAVGTTDDECLAARRYLAGGNYNASVAWGYCRTVSGFTRDFEKQLNILAGG